MGELIEVFLVFDLANIRWVYSEQSLHKRLIRSQELIYLCSEFSVFFPQTLYVVVSGSVQVDVRGECVRSGFEPFDQRYAGGEFVCQVTSTNSSSL